MVHESQWDPLRRRFVAHFSWTELGVLSEPTGPAWKQALTVASAAYDDTYMPVVPGALFYHAISIRPDWTRTKTAVATIGNHVFYRAAHEVSQAAAVVPVSDLESVAPTP